VSACPTFFKLGGDVIDLLGGGEKSLARMRFVRIGKIGVIDDVPGHIATDRIFSLLEREFEQADVRSAVSGGSPPASDIQVSAAACPEWAHVGQPRVSGRRRLSGFGDRY